MKMTSTKNSTADILAGLYRVVLDRKHRPRPDSYVSTLLNNKNRVLRKIIEEADELCAASQQAQRSAIIHETADLWFHSVVLLGAWEIPPEEICNELMRRWGRSGLQEKAQRTGT